MKLWLLGQVIRMYWTRDKNDYADAHIPDTYLGMNYLYTYVEFSV